jgi:pSer/pThr/pTyr-binding forkhead associated (FHA) protein
MKLIRVGRSSSCDIVLPSENVSSLHAEILVMDSGEIFIEDKNSSNGTKVGNKKIAPNTEVAIRRGDYVVLADTELPWSRVPAADNLKSYKQVVNIGTSFKNDLVIEGTYCSRYHASLRISKNGRKAFIHDSNSRNGVKVNGIKIQPGKDTEIKRGDVVLCGDTDITEELKPYLPNPFGFVKKLSIAVVAVAAILALIFVVPNFIIPGRKVDPVKMRPAVVFVYIDFYYQITLADNPFPSDVWNGTISLENKKELAPYTRCSGTAFFIDKEGRMGTNRHVAVPWAEEYREKEVDDYIKNCFGIFVSELIGNVSEIKTQEDFAMLYSTDLGKVIAKMSGLSVEGMNAIINRLRRSPYKITGVVNHRFIGYPGRNYTTPVLEMERCDLIAESGTDDKDVAILQLNSKKTPDDIERIFDINNLSDSELEPLKDNLYMIGYPNGLTWGQDNVTHSLEPVIRSVKCSKVPSRYDFEFEGESVGGASGSPIFDDKGRLAGVLWGRWAAGTTYGKACQAKWLKELYDKEVKY